MADGAAAARPAAARGALPVEPTFSPEAIAIMDAMDFRALHLARSLHGLDSAVAVYRAGMSQLEAYDGIQKRLFSDLHNIFTFYGIDQRKGRVQLSILRNWLKDLEIHTYVVALWCSWFVPNVSKGMCGVPVVLKLVLDPRHALCALLLCVFELYVGFMAQNSRVSRGHFSVHGSWCMLWTTAILTRLAAFSHWLFRAFPPR